MLQEIRQISILNKIFNVHGSEWPKIAIAWVLRFLYQVGFVLGWTIIVAMFVSEYGIAKLPFLFVLNAVFTILGTFIFSILLNKFDKEKLMIWTVFLTGLILFIAAYFFASNGFVFFLSLMLSTSFFMVHFKILLTGYIERLFTPLQSERTFPLIEASETVGGIVAGLSIVLLSNSMQTYKFVYIWVAALFLLLPFILFYESISRKVVVVSGKNVRKDDADVLQKLKAQFLNLKNVSFVRGLFLIVFLQWLLFNLLEFQYTKAVYKTVSDVVLQAGSGFEHAFVHDLGALFMLFSFSALLIQFFLGSRLINYLGVIGSMLLHPIVTVLSLIPLVPAFNFTTAVLAKNNFTITTVIHTNAYHSAYYGIREDLREHTRELLEGVVRPLGAIAGTAALILLQKYFVANSLISSVNILMLAVALIMFYVTFVQQNRYTDVAVDDLVNSDDKELRFNAIDILGQKGHRNAIPALLQVLRDEDESVSIKLRILHALRELQAYEAVPDILHCLKNRRSSIRNAAIDTLLGLTELKKHSDKYLFLKLDLINSLKDIFRAEKRLGIRQKIITLLSRVSTIIAVEFLLDILDGDEERLKAEAINALRNFNDEDVAKRLYPFLKSTNINYQINAAIALYKFGPHSLEAEDLLDEFLRSRDLSKKILAVYAVGELSLRRRKRFLMSYLNSEFEDLRIESALSLAKMGYQEAIPVLVDLLFSESRDLANKVKRRLKNVDVRVYKNIDKIVKHVVDNEVRKIVDEDDVYELDDLNRDNLVNLRWLYSLAEEYDEVENIDRILKI